jgi:phosphodiesterase/alkaline phosphatase D-like protein
MKKTCLFIFALALSVSLAQAQAAPKPSHSPATQQAVPPAADETSAEKAVHITSGPEVKNLKPTSATIVWATDKNSATDVHYGTPGTKEKIAYEKGGSMKHSVNLTGLKPNETYNYKLMTREKHVRFEGTFKTPAK